MAALMRQVHEGLTQPNPDPWLAGVRFFLFVGTYLVGALVADHSMNVASERLQADLRVRIMRHFLEQPLRSLERLGQAKLMNLLIADVRTMADFACRLPQAFIDLAVVIGCFSYMAWLSPVACLFNVVFIVIAAVCYVLPDRAAQRIQRAAAGAWDRQTAQIHFALQGLKLLRLSRAKREDFVKSHFEPICEEARVLSVRGRLLHLLAERFGEAMLLGNVACLLFVLPRFTEVTPATATGLLLAAVFVRSPLKDSLGALSRARRASLALERLRESGIDATALMPRAALEPAGTAVFSRLTFDGVTFQYEGDHDQPGFTVGPFSFDVRQGEVIFIVGGNGMGKTTLAKLVAGLYAPVAGQVWLNGEAIRTEADRERLRACFAATFTEDPLFDHVLGLPAAVASTRGQSWLERLKLAHKVTLAGTAFSTIDLSQGQRRRLILLSALVDERPVLLLDEWAADQDPEFRTFFYEELVPAWRAQGKTLLLITHDDRYFNRADRLLKLDSGRLVG